MQKMFRFTLLICLSLIAASLSQVSYADQKKFHVGLTLLSPISLTLKSSLSFPSISAGKDTTVVTQADSNDAVIFSASGEANTYITGSVVEDFVVMTTGEGKNGSERIIVDSFSTGGDLNETGTGMFDNNGELNDLRIGATAHVQANDIPGYYSSSATFRLTYN